MSTDTCPMCSVQRLMTQQANRLAAAFILGGIYHTMDEVDRAKLRTKMCDKHSQSISAGYETICATIDNFQAGLS